LGLTGTIPADDYRQRALDFYCPVVYTRTIAEAVEDGAVSDFTVYNVPVELDKKSKFKYKIFDGSLTRAKMELFNLIKTYKFPSIFDMAAKCKTDEKHPAYKPSKEFWGAMTMRKKVVYEAPAKISIVYDLLTSDTERR